MVTVSLISYQCQKNQSAGFKYAVYWLSMILPPGLTLRGHSTHSLAEQKNEWPDLASEGLKMTSHVEGTLLCNE